jgi:superfamily II DNA or RNA helicase
MGELKTLLPGLRVGILQGDVKQLGEIERKPLTTDELKAELRKAGLPVSGTKTVLLQRLRAVVPEEPAQRYDCCIAMIQTLSQREYGHDEFQDFGLTIFDECHHLGAEHFSRSLLKVQTKWMLGLSATPTRDDGLSKVFEWFIGKAVYWEKIREADPDVIVQRIGFSSEDPAYTEVPVDARGEPVLARLLGQVVGCEERNLLIDGILRKVLEEPLRKILVLSERKDHLHRINANLPPGTTSSYYIGGMDSDTRQNGAATARVLLGTYAMASEAMNVKTLNTMIMISPRKKIEQSTGRILRTQKDARNIAPLIIDMVDMHGVYQGQWGKRKTYYKKCAYKIQDVVGDYELPGPDVVAPKPKAQNKPVADIQGIPNRYMFEDD